MLLTRFTDRLVSNKLRQSDYQYRKAKIVIYTQIVLLLLGVGNWVASHFIEVKLPFPYHVALPIAALLILTFRYVNNLSIIGNIMAAVIACCLVPMTYQSGGLYSDNLIWLLVVPMMAFFLADVRSGLFWTAGLLVFQAWLYYQEQYRGSSFAEELQHITAGYYYVSFLFFFIAMVALIMVFKTGQNRIIQTLNEQKKTLAQQKQEIALKAKELEKVEQDLRSTNLELEQFAYIVSHDLKQPLRNINNFSMMLQRHLERQREMDANTEEFLGFITGSVKNMNQLIEDLITYARVSKKAEREEEKSSIEGVKNIILSNLHTQITENDARIYWQNLPEQVQLAQVKMVQLLQNLVSNAIKYRREEVMPIIIISSRETHDHYEFAVRDNGMGIAKENQQKVFDIFIKLQSNAYHNSSGIGLATCKKIVEQNQGRIWLESDLGRGSVFYFTLPKKNKQTSPGNADNEVYSEFIPV
ncbi:MAG: ATP-binding protein [Bacteroidota bacterium]